MKLRLKSLTEIFIYWVSQKRATLIYFSLAPNLGKSKFFKPRLKLLAENFLYWMSQK